MLVGYRALASHESRQGLYLYWRLESPMNAAQLVALTLRDGAGDIVFQTTGDPQQGTYPLDRWSSGEMVTDFYLLSSAEILANQTYYLTVALVGSETVETPSGSITIPIHFSAPA
jgi:hypothetical protein